MPSRNCSTAAFCRLYVELAIPVAGQLSSRGWSPGDGAYVPIEEE